MTRVLYWNIENFAVNKIANPSTAKRHGKVTQAAASQKRAGLIKRVVSAANPDIIIVVEVETAYRGRGQLVAGAGARGAIALLKLIRAEFGSDDWLLVPPLQTGPTEAVAVYFDCRSVQFSGPDVWPGGAAGVAAAGVTPGDYPERFDRLLAIDPVPGGSIWNPGVRENQLAARVQLRSDEHPDQWLDWQAARAPYMVTFWDLQKSRNLAFFAIHAPSKEELAKPYMLRITEVADIVAKLNASEARVVVGDFNVNLLTASLVVQEEYTDLPDIGGYRLLLAPDPRAKPDPQASQGYRGYFATHMKKDWWASCSSKPPDTAYYPAYRYIGTDKAEQLYAIDNAFVRYGANAGDPGRNNEMTILNPVVGAPFGVVDPTPFDAPKGTARLDRVCAKPPPDPPGAPPAQGPTHTAGLFNSFNSWNNYGYIRSTSDHLPLMFVV